MTEYRLNLPITEEEIIKLRIGDVIYLTGMIFTLRDSAHLRALELNSKKIQLPVELKNQAVYHCGPIVKKENQKWKLIAAGPTTSARLNSLTPKFLEIFQPRILIGKGGMNEEA